MSFADTAVAELVEHVLNCVCGELDATHDRVLDQPGCPCRACTVPGSVSGIQNECCDCGQLTVNVERLYPSVEFPRQDINADACKPIRWVADVNVRLTRCVPVFDGDGPEAASCDELERASEIANIDAVTLINAVQCCVPNRSNWRKAMRTVVSGIQAYSDGMCVGWDLRFFADLGVCGCVDEEAV